MHSGKGDKEINILNSSRASSSEMTFLVTTTIDDVENQWSASGEERIPSKKVRPREIR